MPIDITIRARNATSGGTQASIDGNGTIDTHDEAVAALAVMGSGDNVVIVGSESAHPFDRDSLQRIRDGLSSAAPAGESSSANAGSAGLHVAYLNIPSGFPEGSRLFLFLDGNPSPLIVNGAPRPFIEAQSDRRIDVRIPSSTPDGDHQVEYRLQRPNRSESRLARPIHIRPSMATLTNASVVPPNSGTSFGTDPIKVRFTTTLAAEHRVRVSVGNHVETITVPAGAAGRQFEATLSGQPKTWTDTGGTPDRRTRRYTVAVTVTPLGQGDRVGAQVNAGNVAIIQARPRATGHRSATTTNTAPRPRVVVPGT